MDSVLPIITAEHLIDRIKPYYPNLDPDLIRRAYEFCKQSHMGQTRSSGDPYYTHPVEVASILADMHLDPSTIVTALLHDVVEDTHITLDDIKSLFSEEIANLVNGVTKLTQMEMQGDHKQSENLSKLVLAMSKDIRVLLVKLADRMHNMRTIFGIPVKEKRNRIALETLNIFAPLAERIGLSSFQHELEDISFQVLHENQRQSLHSHLEKLTESSKDIIEKIKIELHDLLVKDGLSSQVTGRTKTLYSIWRKMEIKKVDMEELSDVMAFRIIVDDIPACYRALGILHTHYQTVMGRFKDYISTPKMNKYQSLHTCIIGPFKKKIEIQIRTEKMHHVAEDGIAAHWRYKSGKTQINPSVVNEFNWIKDLIDILKNADTSEEFLENTQLEMYSDQVFCFTPKGRLIALPRDATAIDFAYAVHSDIGNTCVGVRINHKHRQLATTLSNGDQVEIITSPDAFPNAEWEDFMVTGRARSALRRFIRQKKEAEFSRLGQALLEKDCRKNNLNLSDDMLKPCLISFEAETVEYLYALMGEGVVKTIDVLAKLDPELRSVSKRDKSGDEAKQNAAFDIKGLVQGMAVHHGNCCYPLPGEHIVGIITTGKGITVHRVDCSVLEKFNNMPELWLEIEWNKDGPSRVTGRLIVVLLNEPGSLASITKLISQYEGNISNIHLRERSADFFRFQLDVEVTHIRHLNAILAAMRSNQFVESVEREKI
jgi:guanosine-3',5'-bis(diphosphate) 3'-pyrophosphohydrolase